MKGHKKKVKLKPFLDKIDKIWDQFLVRKPDGQLFIRKKTDQLEREQDAYLKGLRKRNRKTWLWTVPNLTGNAKLPRDWRVHLRMWISE